MRVGIDYTAAIWQSAGIGRYTRELIRAAVVKDSSFRYDLFYAAGGLKKDSPYLAELRRLCATHRNVRTVPIPLSPRMLTALWHRFQLPLGVEFFTGQLDLLHAPDFTLPPTGAHTLVTIHDLSFLVCPECFESSLQRYLATKVPESLRHADLILADSYATRTDLTGLLEVKPERIEVVYPGVSPQFQPLPASQTEPMRQRLGLPEEFLLFVSTLEPRKNITRLLEAIDLLSPKPYLVLAGRKGWLYQDIFATVERLGLQSCVRFLDFIADEDLPVLYNLARLFVYPSLYEGFGLPVVEAMACGTPVVTADVASLPEAAGKAAILVDPHDSEAIAAGINAALEHSAQLREAGLLQARQFTWERSAQALLECYHSVHPSL